MTQTQKKDVVSLEGLENTASPDSSIGHAKGSSRRTNSDEEKCVYSIAEKETRQISLQRVMVIAVLLVAAIVISLAVYFVTTKAEEDEFVAHFEGGAEKIVFSFKSIVQEKLGAIGSLCLALTAAGKHTPKLDGDMSDAWPFVTMDSFHERAASARMLSNVLHMSVIPLVTEENSEAWEAYSIKNTDWYAEGFAYQQSLLENGFRLDGPQRRELKEHKRYLRRQLKHTEMETYSTNTTEAEEFDLFVPFIYEFTEDCKFFCISLAFLAELVI